LNDLEHRVAENEQSHIYEGKLPGSYKKAIETFDDEGYSEMNTRPQDAICSYRHSFDEDSQVTGSVVISLLEEESDHDFRMVDSSVLSDEPKPIQHRELSVEKQKVLPESLIGVGEPPHKLAKLQRVLRKKNLYR
jgi:hypothetical protein